MKASKQFNRHAFQQNVGVLQIGVVIYCIRIVTRFRFLKLKSRCGPEEL